MFPPLAQLCSKCCVPRNIKESWKDTKKTWTQTINKIQEPLGFREALLESKPHTHNVSQLLTQLLRLSESVTITCRDVAENNLGGRSKHIKEKGRRQGHLNQRWCQLHKIQRRDAVFFWMFWMQLVSHSITITYYGHCYETHIVGWRGWGTSGTVLSSVFCQFNGKAYRLKWGQRCHQCPGWVDHHKSVKLQAQQDGKARGGILGTHSCPKFWKLNRLQI